MADENTANAAVQDPATAEAPPIPYNISIEDAGPATKKVSIEIPADVITAKLADQFKDLRREAAIPGFRPGHAPQKLIEKRFNSDVRDQVCRTLVSESYQAAVEKHSLQVIGEPQFDDAEAIKLPESGNLSYTFQVEVQPDFNLPPLTGLKITRQKVEVNDQYIDKAMANLREQQGSWLPVEDRGVEAGDQLIADVHVKADGQVVGHLHDAQFIARRGRLWGILIEDLGDRIAGMKPGETREATVRAPDAHAEEKIRGKDVVVEIKLKEIKKLELAEINAQFLDSLGFTDEKELRQALAEQMKERIDFSVQQSMRDQISNYLLQEVKMDLPEQLSDKQTERIVTRRRLDMLLRGVPEANVEERMEELRTTAKEEVVKELKLYFILQKIASMLNVEVTEGELNGRIAIIAAQAGKRPEKAKQEMSADGSLANMYVQMREQKALDHLTSTAEVEDTAPPAEEPAPNEA